MMRGGVCPKAGPYYLDRPGNLLLVSQAMGQISRPALNRALTLSRKKTKVGDGIELLLSCEKTLSHGGEVFFQKAWTHRYCE